MRRTPLPFDGRVEPPQPLLTKNGAAGGVTPGTGTGKGDVLVTVAGSTAEWRQRRRCRTRSAWAHIRPWRTDRQRTQAHASFIHFDYRHRSHGAPHLSTPTDTRTRLTQNNLPGFHS